MRLKSFIDVISTDLAYTNHKMGFVEKEQDIMTGEDLCYIYTEGDVRFKANPNNIEEIDDLRDKIFSSLENQPEEIILIDEVKGNIYTSIEEKKDSFFYRLAKNVESYTLANAFKNANDLKEKIDKMLPHPTAGDYTDNGYRECVLV